MFLNTLLVINKDKNILERSSSGGLFYELAKYILDNKGVVFGAAWNKDWLVDMIAVESLDKLDTILRSKYLQANIGDSFKKCKEYLDAGRIVLYSGTPCQIASLKSFLKKDYTNLYTSAICCHGDMPANIWKDYLDKVLLKKGKIKNINMRDKGISWHNFQLRVEYEDGSVFKERHKDNVYYKAFLGDSYLKRSCYECPFKNENCKADLTLGDFWNVEEYDRKINTIKGVSAIIVHTEKGNFLINKVKDKFYIKEHIDFNIMKKKNGGFKNSIDKSKIKEYDPSLFDK